MKRPIFFSSFLSTNCNGSKFLTSAAIWAANCEASKWVMRATPLLPASRLAHTSGLVLPTPQISPTPVTTTRRATGMPLSSVSSFWGILGCAQNARLSPAPPYRLLCGFGVLLDVVYGVLHGADLLRILIRDFNVEGLFEGHDQLDCVQGVCPQIVHEGSSRRNLAFLNAQLLDDDLFYLVVNACHTTPYAGLPAVVQAFTRLLCGFGVLVDVVDGVLHGTDLLRILIGNLNVEGLFEGHYQLHHVQGICAQIIYKGSGGCDLRFLHSQLFHDDLLHFFVYGCHVQSPSVLKRLV